MRRLPILVALLALAQASFVLGDEREVAQKLGQLVRGGKSAEAAKVFDAGIQQYPKSRMIRNYSVSLYSLMMRSGKRDKGLEYLGGYVDFMLSPEGYRPGVQQAVSNYAGLYTRVLDQAKKKAQATAKLEAWIAKANQLENEAAGSVVAALYGRKAVRLANSGKKSEALTLITEQLEAVRQAHKKTPKKVASILSVADMLRVRVEVESALRLKSVPQATGELVSFVTEQATKNKGNVRLLSAYFNAKAQQVSRLARSEPAKAEKLIGEIEQFFASVEESPNLGPFKAQVNRTLTSYKRTIASSKRLLALVGKPAFPFGAADWVNGEQLNGEDLKGKVVMIDFWAVWCGPCIATFPHLREWTEKYKEKGFVIVGATRYYSQYQFEDGKLKRAATPLTVAQEQEMLVDFAKHHKLEHRFAVMPKDNTFHKDYLVTGIPQAVIIDRKGVIRLIRVGSGPANAHALEDMIKKCLAEGASE